jgi:hypothetical protein
VKRVTDWCAKHCWRLAWLSAGVALTVWGGSEWLAGQKTAHRVSINVADVESGRPLPGRWVEMTGRLSRDDRVIRNDGEREETYVPLVSETWQPGQPIHVFFRAIKEEGDEPGRLLYHKGPTVEGVVAGRLPWEVRQRFELVDHKPGADAIVVDFQARPDHQDLAIGYVCVPAGLLIVLVTGLLWWSKPVATQEGEAPAEPVHQ